MIMKASQNRFQSNEMTESTFNAAYDAENWKEDSIYSTVDPPAGPAVYKAACPCPGDSHYPENVSSRYRQQGFTISYACYYENNRHAPQQITPWSLLEVSPTRGL